MGARAGLVESAHPPAGFEQRRAALGAWATAGLPAGLLVRWLPEA